MAVTVTTSRGVLGGRPPTDDGVYAFLGVPYGEPPVLDRRFAPPTPAAPWDGVRPAIEHGAASPQALPGPGRPIVDLTVGAEGEDCLTLAIWTPALGRDDRLPVMVWIHGGAFVTGGAGVPAYDGTHLAAQGVVVVNMNYRLGLAGWLRCPEIGASGNQGLADQRAALQWVREEIMAFGGDPENITVFGESAGGASIAAHLTTEGDRPFRRAILQSGAHNLHKTVDEAESVNARVLAEVDGQAERLTTMPLDELMALQERATPRLGGVFFGPVADGDLVAAEPAQTLAGGSGAGIDVIVGSNRDEMGFFWGRDERFDLIDDAFLAALAKRWAARPDEAIETYRRARTERGEPTDNRALAVAMGSDWTFRAPLTHIASWQTTHARAWSYRFDWSSPRHGGLVGAAHTLEIPFVFGTFAHPTTRDFVGGPLDQAQALSAEMSTAWVRFATSGDPGWAPSGPARTTRLFDRDGSTTVDHPADAELAVWS